MRQVMERIRTEPKRMCTSDPIQHARKRAFFLANRAGREVLLTLERADPLLGPVGS
jgi:hypothetical protein